MGPQGFCCGIWGAGSDGSGVKGKSGRRSAFRRWRIGSWGPEPVWIGSDRSGGVPQQGSLREAGLHQDGWIE